MTKDFFEWSRKKSDLHQLAIDTFFHEREVWFASLGANIGFEQDGKGKDFLRPVVVVKKFNAHTFWGMPLTSKLKLGKFYFALDHGGRKSIANLSQLRLMDAKRLKYRAGSVPESEFIELKKRIIQLLE